MRRTSGSVANLRTIPSFSTLRPHTHRALGEQLHLGPPLWADRGHALVPMLLKGGALGSRIPRLALEGDEKPLFPEILGGSEHCTKLLSGLVEQQCDPVLA